MKYFKLLLFVAFCISSSQLKAQNVSREKIDFTVKSWTSYLQNDQVAIDYKFAACSQEIGYNQQKLLLRITNTGSEAITISWHTILEYNGECKTCNYPDEYGYSITIQPNETVEGDCSLEYRHELTFFSKFVDQRYKGVPAELTGFEMRNLSITTTQK